MTLTHPFEEKYKEYNALNNLADLYLSQQRWSEAEPLYVKALSLAYFLHENSTMYITSGQLANIINRLADLYFIRNYHAKAESLYIEVIKLNRRRYQGHSYGDFWLSRPVKNILIDSLSKLEYVYLSQGRSIEAQSLSIEILKIEVSEMLGLDLIHNLGKSISSYYSQSQLRDAMRIHDISLKVCSNIYSNFLNNSLVVNSGKFCDKYFNIGLIVIASRFPSWERNYSPKDSYNNIINKQEIYERDYTASNISSLLNKFFFKQSGMNKAETDPLSRWISQIIFMKRFKSQIVNLKHKVAENSISLFSLNIFMKYLNILNNKILMRKSCSIYSVDTT
jgi:tetratricopeptide (TPR) repeat protein